MLTILGRVFRGGRCVVKKCLFVIGAIILLNGCSVGGEVTVDSIDAEEILRLDSTADIFQYEGVIYKTNIDWVEELTLTKGTQIGEIKKVSKEGTDFKDWMSNKLPVGSKIFSAKERGDILLVEANGVIVKYLAIVEG